MAIRSHVATLQITLTWNSDTQSFTSSGHAIPNGGGLLIPISVPFAILALHLVNTTFTGETPIEWNEPTPPGQLGPEGFSSMPIDPGQCLVYLTNTNLGHEPRTFGFRAVTAHGEPELQIVNMSLVDWTPAAAGRRQVGLASTGVGQPLQAIGFDAGATLRLTSPFTGIHLSLFNTSWASGFAATQNQGSFTYQLAGDHGLSLVAFNAGQANETLVLETAAGPFSVDFVCDPIAPPAGASITVARATLTFDPVAVPTLQWSGDIGCDQPLLIETPFSILAITTVGTEFAPIDPIVWLPGNTPNEPSPIDVVQVSDTELYIYNLDAALGFFSFTVNTTNGPSEPTIINKVPIQT